MEPRSLVAKQGWEWIKLAYALFMKSPLIWIVLVLITFILSGALSAIPVVGDILSGLVYPVFLAGIMAGCRAVELDEELEIAHLFAGFKQQTSQLITFGGITLVMQLLIAGLMMLLGASEALRLMASEQPAQDAQALLAALYDARYAFIVGISLFLVLGTLVQFTVMLVYFNKLSPIEAIKASSRGVIRNIAPLVVYDLVLIMLALLASIPLMLGWVVLIPVVFISLYVAYRNIFPFPENTVEEPPVS